MPELEPVKYRVWVRTNPTVKAVKDARTYAEAKRLGAAALKTNVENVEAEVVREGEVS
jgi:hypothetical protein